MSAVGDHGCKVYVAFNYTSDFDSIRPYLGRFITVPRAAQMLVDGESTTCSRGHEHTCVLSIMTDDTFGVVMVVCLGAKTYRLPDGSKSKADTCKLHLKKVAWLSDDLRQEVTDILVRRRIDEWEVRINEHLQLAKASLIEASLGAANRFEDECLRFQEDCFSRIGALFFRLKDYRKHGKLIIRQMRRETFDVKDISTFHTRWVADRDVDTCVDGLVEIKEEASEFVTPATEGDSGSEDEEEEEE
ncbi:hypothetical protein SCHPADRAFT_941459 [Schizopora paradoxa]|uniref:Uncharacterized protein n=1 Tax=Schizopora paradoxa TaxID=27342 RepID=A0A0H2RRL4_9AGAM|nr:hypothetical protein SCHPADRAFT_941459 [Schizopora paradoxa]